MQFELVMLLQASLANVVGSLVIRLLFRFFNPLQVALGDPPDVTDSMRGDAPERVLAEQPRLHFDAGETIAVRSKLGDFGVAQARSDRDRLKILGLVEQAFETLSILGLDVDHLGQSINGGVQLTGLRRRNFEREGRIIMSQHNPVAVGNDATVGDDGNQCNAIVFGPGLVKIMLNDL